MTRSLIHAAIALALLAPVALTGCDTKGDKGSTAPKSQVAPPTEQPAGAAGSNVKLD